MSYEGYDQCVCEKGHYFEQPETYGSSDAVCPCGSAPAFTNQVDDTNCDSFGIIPSDIFDQHFLVSSAVREACNLGYSHIIAQAIYRIPTKEEAEKFRHYYDAEDAGFQLLSQYKSPFSKEA